MYRTTISWVTTASLFVAAATVGSAAAADGNGVRFQPPGYKFSVQLPVQPKYKKQSTSTVIGSVDTDVWSVQVNSADYSIAITDLPSVALWFNDEESLIEKAREAMLETLGAKQSRLRKIKKGEFSEQLDYIIFGQSAATERRGRAWFALDDDKLIVVSALVPADRSPELDTHFAAIQPSANNIARR